MVRKTREVECYYCKTGSVYKLVATHKGLFEVCDVCYGSGIIEIEYEDNEQE